MLRRSIEEALKLESVGDKAEVNFIRLTDIALCSMGLSGSPTVIVDGVDPFPRGAVGVI